MDYLIGQAAAGLALVTAGVASFVVRDVILERIKRKARQYENYLSITGDPNVRAGARFRAIRTIEGEEFCGPGMVHAIAPGKMTLKLSGHTDQAKVGLRCTVTGEEFKSLVPIWEVSP